MKTSKIIRTISIILGVFLIVYALNQFFHFFPTSYGKMPEFTRAYIDSVVMFLPALYIFEIIVGFFLIFNIWVPFIAIVLTPLSISFLIFNFANGDWNILTAAFVAAMNFLLLILYWPKYRPLFRS